MYRVLFFLLLVSFNTIGQTSIGRTEGAEIIQNEDYYEIILKTTDNQFSSFYIKRKEENNDGLDALKKYVFLLFKNQKESDFLLKFVDDSVLLTYKDGKVQMVKWQGHYSERRECSQWFSFSNYLELFGLAQKKSAF